MALLKDDPRAATVTATSASLTCLALNRATFTKMFGPLQELLHQEAEAKTKAIGKVRRRGADLCESHARTCARATTTPQVERP